MELETDVLIVGGGSRALLVLERLVSALFSLPHRKTSVIIVEPGQLGPGLHGIDQPSYITFNSPNACPTLFINQRIPRLSSVITGLSFQEWLAANEGDLSLEFQPRRVAGRYLSWAGQHLLANLPPNLKVEHLRETIVAVEKVGEGQMTFRTDGFKIIRTHATVLAVGHSFCEPHQPLFASSEAGQWRIISNPFPTHIQLQGIDRHCAVAIQGIGLTALDVLAELTIGRGGRFELGPANALPRYVPSGEEPKIYFFSRSGCPIRSRPDGSPSGSEPMPLVVLTDDRLAELMSNKRPIEFRTEVFPLILAEMANRLLAGPSHLPVEALVRIRKWAADGGARRNTAEIAAFFRSPDLQDPLVAHLRPMLLDGVTSTKDRAMAFLRADIHESRLGLAGSSLKRALEALIEARIFVKRLVDFQHDLFSDQLWIFRTFAGLVNRNVIGAPRRKSEELLALLECGQVDIASAGSTLKIVNNTVLLGRDDSGTSVSVDCVIRADHVNLATPKQAAFVHSLVSHGLLQPVLDAESVSVGIRIDVGMRLLAPGEEERPPIWAIGPICDGSSYYNTYVPCIQSDAEYPYFEAERIARAILGRLGEAEDKLGP